MRKFVILLRFLVLPKEPKMKKVYFLFLTFCFNRTRSQHGKERSDAAKRVQTDFVVFEVQLGRSGDSLCVLELHVFQGGLGAHLVSFVGILFRDCELLVLLSFQQFPIAHIRLIASHLRGIDNLQLQKEQHFHGSSSCESHTKIYSS